MRSTEGVRSSDSAYQFDSAGNITFRSATTGSAGTTQQLSWNDDGTLGSVVNNPGTANAATSSYIYDGNGSLLLQKNPGTTILYLPGEQVTLNTSTGAITGTRFYHLPGGGQVVRTGADPATAGSPPGYVFQLGDLHGTANLTIGPDLIAASATWREFTPYGGSRGQAVTWADNLGFLNKPTDAATGLTDIGARWYDPVTSTFQSLDPLFEATSPQQHNGYTYAGGNPITGSDPTGLVGVGCTGAYPNNPNRPGDNNNPDPI
jgi:RHS repeat-associated protein